MGLIAVWFLLDTGCGKMERRSYRRCLRASLPVKPVITVLLRATTRHARSRSKAASHAISSIR